jgi:class 3 adenylate cyclase
LNLNHLKKTLRHKSTIMWLTGPIILILYYSYIHYFGNYKVDKNYYILSITLILLDILLIIFINYKLFSNSWNTNKYINKGALISIVYFAIIIGFTTALYYHHLFGGLIVMIGSNIVILELLKKNHLIIYPIVYTLSNIFFVLLISDINIFKYYEMNIPNIVLLFIYFYWLVQQSDYIKKKNKNINSLLRKSRKDKRVITIEKEKYNQLLLNILPKDIARELLDKGNSKPRYFSSVTVMFTDFVGFTKIAGTMDANELVEELDNCFSYFDSVVKKYNLEKIKTIGDSYMTCGGIPIENKTHTIDSVLAAIEIQSFMSQMKEIKKEQNIPYWELRLGIHTGSLVAGVIGEMKFAYDVFGDTVNTASRMESSGEVGKINISKDTFEEVKEFFDCEYRGKISAKNKGMIDMYFIIGIKEELSLNNERRVPNQMFIEKYRNL